MSNEQILEKFKSNFDKLLEETITEFLLECKKGSQDKIINYQELTFNFISVLQSYADQAIDLHIAAITNIET